MEDHKPITQVRIGDSFTGVYYVDDLVRKTARNDNEYTNITLKDRSGSMVCRYWSVLPDVSQGMWVDVAADVEEYREKPQVVLRRVDPVPEPQDKSEYVEVSPSADHDVVALNRLRDQIGTLGDQAGDATCHVVVEGIFSSDSFRSRFCLAPGSGSGCYGMQGGLLKHTVRVAEMALKMADLYSCAPQDQAVVLAGSLLHRVGAVDAYSVDDCVCSETDRGVLIGCGHLTMARLANAVRRIGQHGGLSQDIVLRLFHAVGATFEGEAEPRTLEAAVVAQAVCADYEFAAVSEHLADDRAEGCWTSYHGGLGRKLFRV